VSVISTNPDSGEGSEHPGFRRSGRIVFTLLAVLVLIGLAPLATVAWKLIEINRESLTTSSQELQLLLASSIANEVDVHVEGLESELVRVAQTLGVAAVRPGTGRHAEVHRTLVDVVDERMLYLRYTYFRGQRATYLEQGNLPEKLEPIFANGLREAAEILARTALSRPEQAIVSDPILLDSEPRRAVLVVTAPVVSRGRFSGVLSALVDLQLVWDSVAARNRTGHVIFVLDDSGQVVASSNPASVVPGRDASGSALVTRFLSSGRRARETLPFVETVDGREQHYLGSYEKTRQGWGVFVQARLEDVYLPVRDMRSSALSWALAVLGVAVLAAVFFAGTLSNPIKRLAAASRAFASGEYALRVSVRSRNEIGELAHTFNMMAAEIEDQIRRLKRAAEENKELFLGTIRALAQAIDAKDPYTRGHSVRVNRYSIIIAREMNLSDDVISDIHVASLMHDVGKIGIHDRILQKPSKLTDEEYEVMKTHTVLGASIMEPIRQMESIIPGLRNHHEKWAGGGYPDGLKGDEIPLTARVIAVADTFDAMTTHRPYQRAMTFTEAVELLNKLKLSVFDERVIEAFNRAYRKGLIAPESQADETAEADLTEVVSA
jgi:HD-GYP domain-containing protein (c-di-GMP phosphodiesterase class II)